MMGNGQQEDRITVTQKMLDNIIPAIICIWLFSAVGVLLLSLGVVGVRIDQFALLGDSMGTANALFSALAVILVLLSLREQQEEIKAMRNEADGRRLREKRAATAVIEVAEGTIGKNEHSVTYKLTNSGQTVYDVRWLCEGQPILVWDTPAIIGAGASFNVTLDLQPLKANGPVEFSSLPPFEIHMMYVDSAGNKRDQKYLCTPSRYKGFQCIDHGLPEE